MAILDVLLLPCCLKEASLSAQVSKYIDTLTNKQVTASEAGHTQ